MAGRGQSPDPAKSVTIQRLAANTLPAETCRRGHFSLAPLVLYAAYATWSSRSQHLDAPSAPEAAARTRPPNPGGGNLEGAYYGPFLGLADPDGRIRSYPLSGRDPAVSDAGTAAGIHVGQALARARRPRGRAQARHQPSASGCENRDGLSRLWPADRRGHFRRQCRVDAGGEAF